MPDIDVDFCQDRREEVIEHVRVKYGSELVSQIITYGNLKAKAATKDIARIVGLDFNASNRIAKLIPDDLGITLDDAIKEENIATRIEGDPVVGRLFNLAKRVEGMTRQTGVHAAGVVIADRPLVEHAPLYRDGPEGGPVVQYDMKSAESVGLIKFDFLGLKTLDQIRDAVNMIERNTGERPDMDTLPVDDEATFALLQRGDGLGVFQVESSGMRELLTRLRPSNIDDLIALLWPCTDRVRSLGHGRHVHRLQARTEGHRVPPPRASSPFSRAPTAASSTRSRSCRSRRSERLLSGRGRPPSSRHG